MDFKNLLNTEDQWVPSAVVMVLLYSQYEKVKRKILKPGKGLYKWASRIANWGPLP